MQESSGLRRFKDRPDNSNSLFDKLDEAHQNELIVKHIENKLSLERDEKERISISETAENDLQIGLEQLKVMDANKKIYKWQQEVVTGSGKIEIKVKGGDVSFIVPIIIAVGVITALLFWVLKH